MLDAELEGTQTPLAPGASDLQISDLLDEFSDVFVAGGFWAVILSRAAWKKSWVGRDPTRSIIPTDRSVAITGNTARAQLLTA